MGTAFLLMFVGLLLMFWPNQRLQGPHVEATVDPDQQDAQRAPVSVTSTRPRTHLRLLRG